MRTIPLLTSWGESEKLCVQDLLALSTLSALWIDKDSEHIATEAAQALAGLLELEFAAVQFSASSGAETFRHSAPKGDFNGLNAKSFEALPQMKDQWRTSGVSDWQSSSDGPVMRIARIPIGLRNDGWLFAGSIDRQFPNDFEFVVLSTFAFQIAVALQSWLIKQAPRESDERFRQFAEYSADALWILDADVNADRISQPRFRADLGTRTHNDAR